MRKNNFILLGCLVVFICLTFFFLRGVPFGKPSSGYGPAFYPVLLLGLLVFLMLILFIQTLRLPKDTEEKTAKLSIFSDVSYRNAGFFLLLFFIYTLTIRTIGFLINSFLFLTIAMMFLKTKWKQAVLISAVVVGILYCMFKIILRVRLPSGLLRGIGL